MLDAGRGPRYSTPEQFAAMQRRSALKPGGAAATQMERAARGCAVAIAWNVWLTETSLSKMEDTVEMHVAALAGLKQRQELLIGYTILMWSQDKRLAFARTCIIAWARIATCATRDANVAALESDRAMLEETVVDERQRRSTEVGQLVNQRFVDNYLSWFQGCFMEWKRVALVQERTCERRFQEVRDREVEACEHIQELIGTAMHSITNRNVRARCFQFFVHTMVALWYAEALRRHRDEAKARQKLRVSSSAGSLARLFCPFHLGNDETTLRLAMFSWKSVLLQPSRQRMLASPSHSSQRFCYSPS